MDVPGISKAQNQQAASAGGPQKLGKEDFLQLLVTQLSNQDPLNPLDDKEFVAQMAQFSSLEQMMQMNEQLTRVQMTEAASSNAQLSTLIGQRVTVRNDTFEVVAGESPQPISFSLKDSAANVEITIRDEQGATVRTLSRENMKAGQHDIAWDGLDANGQPVVPGQYTISIRATDTNGQPVSTTSRVTGTVDAVRFDGGQAELVIGSTRVRPADVVRVEGDTNEG